jgi:Putative MetA-pathway of phenol degradation
MTRLRKLAVGGAAAALIMTGAVSKSFAIESGAFQYLAGASIGVPAGAAAPPGVYTGLVSAYGIFGGMTGNQGATGANGGRGTGLGSFIGIVPIVWSTGYNFLGASYSVAVIQPFVNAFVANPGGASGVVGGTTSNGTTCVSASGFGGPNSCVFQNMFINTVWQPLNLSWNFGGGWFGSVAFTFQAPEGTKVPGIANPDFWTFQPGWAISYLGNNWNASLNMSYNVYTASQGIAMNLGGTPFGNGYTSGNQLVGDWYATYKIGKWQFGPAGYFVAQTTSDRAGGGGCGALAAAAPALACANQNFVGVGGLVGYDFGPVDIQVWATDTVWQQNTGESGWLVWSRVSFRLWAPEAPKPLVAKN